MCRVRRTLFCNRWQFNSTLCYPGKTNAQYCCTVTAYRIVRVLVSNRRPQSSCTLAFSCHMLTWASWDSDLRSMSNSAQLRDKCTWRSWHVANENLESGIRFSETYTELFLKFEQNKRNTVECWTFQLFQDQGPILWYCNCDIFEINWHCEKIFRVIEFCAFSNIILESHWTKKFSIYSHSSWNYVFSSN